MTAPAAMFATDIDTPLERSLNRTSGEAGNLPEPG
jgi:hypothetical protein